MGCHPGFHATGVEIAVLEPSLKSATWGFYGQILKAMAAYPWPGPLNACFEFPVYAFGYNWSASNDISGKKLATYIDQVIAENAALLPCKHVILVTHSMGGLVARSACKLHGAEGKVLGVVHGVQPATGAPAAYFRMKNGFEPPAAPRVSSGLAEEPSQNHPNRRAHRQNC